MSDDINPEVVYRQNEFIVQHDWNEVEDGGKIYVGYRKYGENSHFINAVKVNGVIETGLEDAVITRLSEQKLHVKYANYGDKTFVAPSVQLDRLHEAAISSVDLSSSGKFMVSADLNSEMKVCSARTGEIHTILKGHLLDINRCRFFPCEKLVASCGLDMTVRIWSVSEEHHKILLKGHSRGVTDLFIMNNGNQLLSSAKDGSTRLWEAENGVCVHTWRLGNDKDVNAVACDKDSKVFACGHSSGDVALCDLIDKKSTHIFSIGHSCTALFINDGICYCGNEKGEIYCYEIGMKRYVSVIKTIFGRVTKLGWTVIGLTASFGDGVVAVFKEPLQSADCCTEFTGANVDPIYDFTYNESVMFSACRDKIIRKYHLK